MGAGEQSMPEVAVEAARRLLTQGGDAAQARQWVLPAWEQVMQRPDAMGWALRVRLARVLSAASCRVPSPWIPLGLRGWRRRRRPIRAMQCCGTWLAWYACGWGFGAGAQQMLSRHYFSRSRPVATRHLAGTGAIGRTDGRREPLQRSLSANPQKSRIDSGYYPAHGGSLEHIIKLTDHRDRELLELTLSKALIDLLRIDRVVVSKVVSEAGIRRWLDVTTLDARGGGKVVDPLRVDFDQLGEVRRTPLPCHAPVRTQSGGTCLGREDGPRISYLPLFADSSSDEAGVVEAHSGAPPQCGRAPGYRRPGARVSQYVQAAGLQRPRCPHWPSQPQGTG